jgi:DNA polymerase V
MKLAPISAQAGIVGFESPASQYTQSSLSLDELLIDHPSATYFASVDGDSMIDAGIFSGDILIVSRSTQIKNMSIIVANLNGVFVCKYLDKENRRLLSANDGFSPHLISEGDEFQIEGVVTRSIRMHVPLKKSL